VITRLLPLRPEITQRSRELAKKVEAARTLLDPERDIDARAATNDLANCLRRAGGERDTTYRPMAFYASLSGLLQAWGSVVEVRRFSISFAAIWPGSDLDAMLCDLDRRFRASISLRSFVIDSRPEECDDLSKHVQTVSDRAEVTAAMLDAEIRGIHAAWIREWCEDNAFWAASVDEDVPF
jgi:hypothetical protein